MANENLAGSVVDGRGQTVLVSANVEYREPTHSIRVWKRLADIQNISPPQTLRYPIPIIERPL